MAAATRGWIDAAVQLVTTTPPTPPSSRNSSLREDVKDPPSTCSSTSTEDSSSLSTSIKDDSLQSIVKDDSTRTAIPSEPSTNSNKSEPPPQPAPKTEPIRHTAAGAPSSELREDPTQAMSVRADSRSSPPEGAAEPRANEGMFLALQATLTTRFSPRALALDALVRSNRGPTCAICVRSGIPARYPRAYHLAHRLV